MLNPNSEEFSDGCSEPIERPFDLNFEGVKNSSELGFDIVDSETGIEAIFEALSQLGKSHGAVIKMQTWRGDEVGLRAAKACEEALNRGASVKLFKDQIGGIFEFGEREGQSFWHQKGERNILDWQAHRLSKFYDNAEVTKTSGKSQEVESARENLKGFENFNLEAGYRYDHSKVVLIYDKDKKIPLKAFVGGVCFGDEWGSEVEDKILMESSLSRTKKY